MSEICGYTSTTELESFNYSGKLDFKFVVPAANLVGTFYSGTLRLSQLFNSDTPGENGRFTFQQLITVSDEVKGMQTGFSLQSAIVNDYILTHTLRSGDDVVSNVLNDELLGSEIVHFIVLQKPAMNITTGASAAFTLIGEAAFNSVVMPGVANLLLYRTFQAIWQGKQQKIIDFEYQGPNSSMSGPAPPVTAKQVAEVVQAAAPDTMLKHAQNSAAKAVDRASKSIAGHFNEPVDINLMRGGLMGLYDRATQFIDRATAVRNIFMGDLDTFNDRWASEHNGLRAGVSHDSDQDSISTDTPLHKGFYLISRKLGALYIALSFIRHSKYSSVLNADQPFFKAFDVAVAISAAKNIKVVSDNILDKLTAYEAEKDPKQKAKLKRGLPQMANAYKNAKRQKEAVAIKAYQGVINPKVRTDDQKTKLKARRKKQKAKRAKPGVPSAS